jgi:protein-S-isoprenylcysteine O-methyltransferase Ste14
MGPFQVVPIITGASCFTAYAAGTSMVFRRGGRATAGLCLITVGAAVGGTTELTTMALTPVQSPWRSAAGTVLFAGALTLFLAAAHETRRRPLTPAFSEDVPTHLVCSGPYRLVRHPFYTAYLITYIAGWVVSGVTALLVVFAGMGTLYAVAARREEDKFQRSPLAQDYTHYAARTGMFWPVVRWRTRSNQAAEPTILLPDPLDAIKEGDRGRRPRDPSSGPQRG